MKKALRSKNNSSSKTKRLTRFPFSQETILSTLIILIAAKISEVSFLYYFQKGETLTYYDSIVRLNTARATMDSITPGIMQLGSIWLPLPQLLMLPFIWSDFFWRSGIAGSIVSMIAYVVTVFFLYKVGKLVTNSYLSGIVVSAIVGLNPNVIYMQTTPMTESLALATISAFLYYLIKWSKSDSLSNLIIVGICGFLATLTRYETWFLVGFGMCYVFWVSYKKKQSSSYAFLRTVLYGVISFVGIFIWFLYNAFIFGSPFYFLNGPFLAKNQQNNIYKAGVLPTKHNLFLSLSVYTWDVIDIAGISIVCVAILSFIIFIFKEKNKNTLFLLLVAFGPGAVIILTLYFGITAIFVPQIAVNNTFGHMMDMRYGLMSLPFIALTTSLLAARKKYIAGGLLLIIVLQAVFMYKNNALSTLNEPLRTDNVFTTVNPMKQVASTLTNNCKSTTTLIMLSGQGVELLESNLDIRNVIYEGNDGYWQKALKNPTQYVSCIVMGAKNNKKDTIRTALLNTSVLKKNYRIILKNSEDVVYKAIH